MAPLEPAPRETLTNIAGDVVGAFKTSPVLLLIVLLNMAFAGAASYFMVHLESWRHEAMVTLMDRCIPRHAPPPPP